MLLKDILAGLKYELHGKADQEIGDLSLSSKKTGKNLFYTALVGTKADGHDFIEEAIQNGATAVLCQAVPTDMKPEISYVIVENTQKALGSIASNFYNNPTSSLKLVGVTGTNGKTTTATLLYEVFKARGYSVGLISTVENKIQDTVVPATHTTPDPISLNKLLADMVKAGCKYAFMEVSSHSVSQERISGLTFAGGIFTNLTQDHLDYHKTMEDYAAAKQKFFTDLPITAFALSNSDDPHGKMMLEHTQATKYFYSLKDPAADFYGSIIENTFAGLKLKVGDMDIEAPLIGTFNAYNLLAVYSACSILGEDKEEIKKIVKEVKPPAGRFQYVRSADGKVGIVDYAHTPDALFNVLKTIKDISKTEKIITVVGCGGDRDALKRPQMAKIAQDLSDYVIFTSDNPRSEDPEKILDDMFKGLEEQNENIERITDRREAIVRAVEIAQPGDIILLAGKGHETYQEINGIKSHFDDKDELEKAFL